MLSVVAPGIVSTRSFPINENIFLKDSDVSAVGRTLDYEPKS
jgi:hypothetical protein